MRGAEHGSEARIKRIEHLPGARLMVEAPRKVGGMGGGEQVELGARIDLGGQSQRLWWRLPAAWAGALTSHADPYVIAFLFPLMQSTGEVVVEGAVSPSLLENLETFMAIWHGWFPERYRPVRIRAREEIEAPIPQRPESFLTPFSCGVDSCFTFFRHHRGLAGRRSRHIGAAVMVHGFDVGLDERSASAIFEGMRGRAGRMLEGTGVPCIPITSNFRRLSTRWGHSHGTQLVATLALLGGRFGGALIPNSITYTHLQVPWGSHPLTDGLLGRSGFAVHDDGAEFTRVEKLEMLRRWPGALEELRVCLVYREGDGNCGRCEKCILTALAARVAGIERLPAVAPGLCDDDIAAMRITSDLFRESWADLAGAIRSRQLDATGWARALRVAQRRGRRRMLLRRLRAPLLPLQATLRGMLRDAGGPAEAPIPPGFLGERAGVSE